jgi:hypothetical protein
VRRPAICVSVSNASLSDVASLAAKVGSDMAVFYHAVWTMCSTGCHGRTCTTARRRLTRTCERPGRTISTSTERGCGLPALAGSGSCSLPGTDAAAQRNSRAIRIAATCLVSGIAAMRVRGRQLTIRWVCPNCPRRTIGQGGCPSLSADPLFVSRGHIWPHPDFPTSCQPCA